MIHKVNDVDKLYESARELYKYVVSSGNSMSADNIIENLYHAINSLKNSWEGKDAGVQIQNVINVYNAMVNIRNILCELAVKSSEVASKYREVQNANGANLENLTLFHLDNKSLIENYTDTRDMINISAEANAGKSKIDTANSLLPGFIAGVMEKYNSIMENWISGTGKDNIQEEFSNFITKTIQYEQILYNVSMNITKALQNYTI